MGRSVSTFILLVLLAAVAPSAVVADDRPTSGDLSVLSGRTFGSGENVLAAGIGLPGIWAGAFFAPTPRFNFGLRGMLLYQSSVMGFGGGIGGEVSVPVRIHLFGRGQLDLALAITPTAFFGEGSLAGQTGIGDDESGYGARLEAGLLAGMQVTQAVTLIFGLQGGPAFVDVPDVANADHFVGLLFFTLGVEALPSRDTVLFAVVDAGYGFAPESLYEGHEVLRFVVGVAYLL
jgi:hypothetical protein